MKSAKKKKNAPKIPAVTRRAFTMRLKPGSFDEYKKYHDNIWPELVREIEKSGIAQITTFENEMQLFLYSEIYDEKAWDRLWNSKIHDKWAESMGPLMQFRADGKVDAGPLREIFHLKTSTAKSAKRARSRAR